MNGEKLESCPFCGKEAEITHHLYIGDTRVDEHEVHCSDIHECGCSTSIGNKKEMIRDWNTRALTAPQSAASELLEALENVLKMQTDWVENYGGRYGVDINMVKAAIAKARGE